ncbi:MAG TPA: serine esterase [bacterium]|nr:serine esterase [bacterium]
MLQGEFIPSADKTSRRLFVVLHGLGDSPAGWRWLPDALKLPWLNYLLVQAPDDYFGGYSWFNYPGDIAPGIHRSRKLLFELLDNLRAKNFPADQITLGGFSQGCLMSLETGLRYPHRLAGIVGLSGWVFEIENLIRDLTPVAKSQRLLITHGHYDPLLPFAGVSDQVKQLKAAGLNVEWREYPKEHTIHGEEEVSAIREFVRAGYPVVDG